MSIIVPTASPQNISLQSLNATTLLVSWNPVEEPFQNGKIRFYRVFINDMDNSHSSLQLDVSQVTTTIVTDLKPFHTYSVELAAYTIDFGPTSIAVNVTQPQSGIVY